jgi:hypothetical protein
MTTHRVRSQSSLLMVAAWLALGGSAVHAQILSAPPPDPAAVSGTTLDPTSDAPRLAPPPPSPVRHPRHASAAAPLQLTYWIELREPLHGTPSRVSESRLFSSGERIRLHFRSETAGYLKLIQIGASGASSVLFPAGKGPSDNHIPRQQDRIFPQASWLRFDDHAGVERLVVLFARTPAELDTFPVQPSMDAALTEALLAAGTGQKDLELVAETADPYDNVTTAGRKSGKPILLEIALKHH